MKGLIDVPGIVVTDNELTDDEWQEAVDCLDYLTARIEDRQLPDWKTRAIVALAMRILYTKDEQ
jgi:hypothetical protein